MDTHRISERRFQREDGSLGPPQKAPWRKWSVLGKADRQSAVLNAVATALTAGALYWGSPQMGNPLAFAIIAPLVGAGFFIALIAQFLERDNRHGLVRALLAGGAAVLAVTGVAYAGDVEAGRILLFYWAPAILAIMGAILLQRAHRQVESPEVPVHVRKRP
jgi:hypothetical protein